MRRKASLPAALLIFLFVFTAPVFADLSDTVWNVDAVVKAQVKIKGIGSDSTTESASDTFEFDADGSFDMLDASGTWRMAGKKFYVDLDTADLAGDLKTELEVALLGEGIDAQVSGLVITLNGFSGKENKNGTIKGKWKLAFACSIYVDSVGRSFDVAAKTTTNFSGRLSAFSSARGLESTGSPAASGEAAHGSLFGAIGAQVRQAMSVLAPLP